MWCGREILDKVLSTTGRVCVIWLEKQECHESTLNSRTLWNWLLLLADGRSWFLMIRYKDILFSARVRNLVYGGNYTTKISDHRGRSKAFCKQICQTQFYIRGRFSQRLYPSLPANIAFRVALFPWFVTGMVSMEQLSDGQRPGSPCAMVFKMPWESAMSNSSILLHLRETWQCWNFLSSPSSLFSLAQVGNSSSDWPQSFTCFSICIYLWTYR
jgi:hypothetical protein